MEKGGTVYRHVLWEVIFGTVVLASLPGIAAAQSAPSHLAAAAGARTGDPVSKDTFVDPLDAPAIVHRRLAGRPLMSIARAGNRLVAVGMRGLIEVSDDNGKQWKQVAVPVRSDLLSASFPTPSEGWVVGHDSVVLHTADGGNTWIKQLDGRAAGSLFAQYYRERIASGETQLKPYLDQIELNYKQGPSLPFLSVCFSDARRGMAVGPFGMAIATVDGGKSWVPVLDRIDNPQFLHLDAIASIAGHMYIAGEQGTVYTLDVATGMFIAHRTGYAGSFFGVTGNRDVLLAYGLKGTLYRSADSGQTWTAVRSPLRGTVTGAQYVPQRDVFVLVTVAGEMALADSQARSLKLTRVPRPAPMTGVQAAPDDTLVLSGLGGAQLATLP
jgi:photosystem II stability/assembly factor-like uncharacterized protein